MHHLGPRTAALTRGWNRSSAGFSAGRGQSAVEFALVLPLLVLLLAGLVEVVFYAHTYMVLLSTTREGSRLGARGAANFDDTEIDTLVEQELMAHGIDPGSGLVDVMVIRADVGPGQAVTDYTAVSFHGSGRPVHLSESLLLSRLSPSDPSGRLVAVEVHYDHRPVLGLWRMVGAFPSSMELHPYSIMRVLQ